MDARLRLILLLGATVTVGRVSQVPDGFTGAFPLHESTVFELFEDQHLAFSGVLLRDLLVDANAGGATEIDLVALDDHQGPIRMVFTAASEIGSNPDLWIWNVASAELR